LVIEAVPERRFARLLN